MPSRSAAEVRLPPAAASTRSRCAVEREHLERVLAAAGGNRTSAADRLGISRRTFYRRLQKHNLLHQANEPSTV